MVKINVEDLSSTKKRLQIEVPGEIVNREIVLPRECDIVKTFAGHMHNVAKKLEEDEETGSKRYVYVKLGPDHFRHAFNYEAMARQTYADLVFPNL